MREGPDPHHATRRGRQCSIDCASRRDRNFSFCARVDRVKVRRRMIAPIHVDRNSIELADLRHFASTLRGRGGGNTGRVTPTNSCPPKISCWSWCRSSSRSGTPLATRDRQVPCGDRHHRKATARRPSRSRGTVSRLADWAEETRLIRRELRQE